MIAPLPQAIEIRIGPPPSRYVYGMVDGDVVKLAVGTRSWSTRSTRSFTDARAASAIESPVGPSTTPGAPAPQAEEKKNEQGVRRK